MHTISKAGAIFAPPLLSELHSIDLDSTSRPHHMTFCTYQPREIPNAFDLTPYLQVVRCSEQAAAETAHQKNRV